MWLGSINFLLLSITSIDPSLAIDYAEKFEPDWKDLDTRVLPRWYDEAKVGIFIHWGVYSVPAYGNGVPAEWFWYFWRKDMISNNNNFMKKNYPPGFTYQKFAPMFKAELFDANKWADLFVRSGAKYVVLTSKHHDGFTLFPSKYAPKWNSMHVGPKRDLVHELGAAVRTRGLQYGLYYSLLEWTHPLYNADLNNKTTLFTDQKLMPELKDLVKKYKPAVIWADGDWVGRDYHWKSKEFLAWLYNESPVKFEVVVNDRWGYGIRGNHGDFYNFEDKFNNESLQRHKWENAFSIDTQSWGYRLDMDVASVMTPEDIVRQIVTTVSCGGNVLINVGPTKEGIISPIFQERLLSMGSWLSTNGEAIYKTSPWLYQNDPINRDVWYTCIKTVFNARRPTEMPTPDDTVTAIYAILLKWPANNILEVQGLSYLRHGRYRVEFLGKKGKLLKWGAANGVAQIRLPNRSTVTTKYAWTVRFTKKK